MAHPWHHAERSARLFGGRAEDYVEIHQWFDESKAHYADLRHRALRHHSEGIFLCEKMLGVTIVNSDGKRIPVRLVGEQHVKDDLGWIPSLKDWLSQIQMQKWMFFTPFKPSTQGDLGPPPAAAQEEEPAPVSSCGTSLSTSLDPEG